MTIASDQGSVHVRDRLRPTSRAATGGGVSASEQVPILSPCRHCIAV